MTWETLLFSHPSRHLRPSSGRLSMSPLWTRKQNQTTERNNNMGIFDKIEGATVTGDGNWVRPGRYTAEINAVKLSKKHTGEEFVAIEMTIVSVLDDDEGKGHKVGEDIVSLMNASKMSFLGNFKQFISASLGVSPDDVTKAEALRVTSDAQPMAGIVVEFSARIIITRAGDPFTKVMFAGEVEQKSEVEG